jgi:hypothetical protein
MGCPSRWSRVEWAGVFARRSRVDHRPCLHGQEARADGTWRFAFLSHSITAAPGAPSAEPGALARPVRGLASAPKAHSALFRGATRRSLSARAGGVRGEVLLDVRRAEREAEIIPGVVVGPPHGRGRRRPPEAKGPSHAAPMRAAPRASDAGQPRACRRTVVSHEYPVRPPYMYREHRGTTSCTSRGASRGAPFAPRRGAARLHRCAAQLL